ncbi:hypothetical protein CP02DC14_1357, partial [Chlamydia psittaci 02DC14]
SSSKVLLPLKIAVYSFDNHVKLCLIESSLITSIFFSGWPLIKFK